MTDRSADDTILGYLYQFDKTIYELLKLPTLASSMQVEGIEDVDILNATKIDAIQCKYYDDQKYSPSKLKDTLLPMLVDYKQNSAKRKSYRIYAHFGDFNKMPNSLDSEAVKKILTVTPRTGKNKGITQFLYRQENLTDREIEDFCKLLVLEKAENFEDQHNDVISGLANQFSCDAIDSENFYYNAALKFIFSIATRPTLTQRTITKQIFLKAVDTKELTFSRWLRKFQGREKYIARMQKQLKRRGFLKSQSTKAVLLGSRYFKGPASSFKHFVNVLIERFYSKGIHLCDATPWTVIVDVDLNTVKELKLALLKENIFFTDGYEHVEFTPSAFDRTPVKTRFRKGHSKRSSDLLGDSSFSLRLVTAKSWKKNRNALQSVDILFSDSDVDLTEYIVRGSGTQIARIDGLENFQDFVDLLPST